MKKFRKFRIASACGAGYATSGWIAAKLMDALQGKGIDADITEVKIMDLAMVAQDFDLIVSASQLSDVYEVPVVASSSIITGVGFDVTLEKIISILKMVEDKEK